jgi:hypothetical protein
MITPMIIKEAIQPAMIPAIALDEMDLGDWADAESTPVPLGFAMDTNGGMIAVVDEGRMEEEPEELKASAAARNCSKVPFPVS